MPCDLILAIDQGTSSTKAVVFDTRGRILARATAPLQSLYPAPGFVEQDPKAILASALDAVRACVKNLAATGRCASDIACAGISNQRETFVLWDSSGAPLANAVVWQCKRPTAICERIRGTKLERDIRERTGLIVDPYFSGTKVMWLYENDSRVRAAIDKGEALFGTVDTWLLWNLTGGASYLTDYTNACRTLFFNTATLGWDRELLDGFGLGRLHLPECRHSAGALGESTFDGIFSRAIPITAMIGDSHASAFGQGCFTPGSVKVTLGTGSSILMNAGSARPQSSHGMVATICFSTASRVDHALEGIIVSCGATLTWLRDQLGLYRDTAELEQAARSVKNCGGVYLVPGFAGLGAPHWRMDARGTLCGLTFATTRAHVLRAALESIAYQVADVTRAMETDTGVRVKLLVADGGISANAFVMQRLADLCDTVVENRGLEEGSALGAALLAALGSGVISSEDQLLSLDIHPVRYTPGAERSVVLEEYEGWKKAVKTVC